MQLLRMLHDVVVVWPGHCNSNAPRHANLFDFQYPTRPPTRRNRVAKRAQHVAATEQCCDMFATVWPELANAEPAMLGYVVLRGVAIVWPEL